MQQLEKTYGYLKRTLSSLRNDHISAFAAYSAFFMILSYLPMLVLVFTISNIVGIDLLNIIDTLNVKNPYFHRLIVDGALSSTAVISISTVFTAWSAGRAFHAIIEGFNVILKINTRKNYIFSRIRSLMFSVIFAMVFVGLIIVGIFSEHIYQYLLDKHIVKFNRIPFFLGRDLFVIIVLFVILFITYRFAPDWKSLYKKLNKQKKRSVSILISAAISSLMIYLFTYVFYIYIDLFSNIPKSYGSMSTLAVVMFWIYGSLYVVLVGFKLIVHMHIKLNHSSGVLT